MAKFTGAFERVGNATAFGQSATEPSSLAWDGTNLWMYDAQTNDLYTINRTTGVATKIGENILSARSGAGATNFFSGGLTSHNSKLTFITVSRILSRFPWTTITLYEINTTTGALTTITNIQNSNRFDGNLFSQFGALASDGNTLYVIARRQNDGNAFFLHSINTSNGSLTKIGTSGNLGLDSASPGGMTWDGESLLYADASGDAIYEIDRTTGIATRIGDPTIRFYGISESNPRGLAWDGTNLFMVGSNRDWLTKALFAPVVFTAPALPTQIHEGQRLEINLDNFFQNANTYAFTSGYTPPAYLELDGRNLVIARSPARAEDETISVQITGSGAGNQMASGVIMITLRPPLPTPAYSPPTEQQSVVSGENWSIDVSTLFTRATSYVFPNDYLVPNYVRLTGSTLSVPTAPDVSENTDIVIRVVGQNRFGTIEGSITLRIVPEPPTFVDPPLSSARTGDSWTYDLDLAFTGATSYAFQDDYTKPDYLTLSGSILTISEVPFVATDTDTVISVVGINDGGMVDGSIDVRFTSSRRPIIGATAPQRYIVGEDFEYIVDVSGEVSDVDVEGLWDGKTYHTWDADNNRIHIIGNAQGRVSGETWGLFVSGPDGQDRRSVVYDYVDKSPVISPIGTHIVRIGRELTIDVVIENSPSRVVVTGSLLALGYRNVNDIRVPGDPEQKTGIRITGTIPAEANLTITQDTFRVIAANSSGSVQEFGSITLLPSSLPSLTGGMRRIGMSNQFGVSERSPKDLAYDADNGILYMYGAFTNRIYTLDVNTGEATLLGHPLNARNFNAAILGASGIAYDRDEEVIYMAVNQAGSNPQKFLARVDPDTGFATRVSGVSDFAPETQAGSRTDRETVPEGLAYNEDNRSLYMIGNNTDYLSILNTRDGTLTRVGNVNGFGVSETSPKGLTYDPHENVFYMTGGDTNALYKVNPSTGVAERIGNITNFGVNETAPEGLAFDDIHDILYFTGQVNDALYTGIREAA